MFYPPSLLDPTPTPKPVPIYDTPIADRQPVRALAWAHRPCSVETPETGDVPGTAPRVVVLRKPFVTKAAGSSGPA